MENAQGGVQAFGSELEFLRRRAPLAGALKEILFSTRAIHRPGPASAGATHEDDAARARRY